MQHAVPKPYRFGEQVHAWTGEDSTIDQLYAYAIFSGRPDVGMMYRCLSENKCMHAHGMHGIVLSLCFPCFHVCRHCRVYVKQFRGHTCAIISSRQFKFSFLVHMITSHAFSNVHSRRLGSSTQSKVKKKTKFKRLAVVILLSFWN